MIKILNFYTLAKTLTIACIVAINSFTIFFSICLAEQTEPAQTADISKRHIYSKYKFDKSKRVINIGIQPLWVPANLIAEVMKRDLILRDIAQKHGMEIQWYPFLKGNDVNMFLAKGDLHAGIGGDMPAITAAATMDIVIPAITQYGFISIVANKQMLISDLKGKRIGYAFGSNAHYALLDILHRAGLGEKDVKLVKMEVSMMPAALEKGAVDAFSAWEPTPTLAVKHSNKAVKIFKSISSGYFYFDYTFVKERLKITYHIIASELRAILWMQNNYDNLLTACGWVIEAYKDFIGKDLALSQEEIADLAMEDIVGMSYAPVISKEQLKINGAIYREFRFLKSLKKAPASVKWPKVYNSFNEDITQKITSESRRYKLKQFNYEHNK